MNSGACSHCQQSMQIQTIGISIATCMHILRMRESTAFASYACCSFCGVCCHPSSCSCVASETSYSGGAYALWVWTCGVCCHPSSCSCVASETSLSSCVCCHPVWVCSCVYAYCHLHPLPCHCYHHHHHLVALALA